jgi:hypothetical protein
MILTPDQKQRKKMFTFGTIAITGLIDFGKDITTFCAFDTNEALYIPACHTVSDYSCSDYTMNYEDESKEKILIWCTNLKGGYFEAYYLLTTNLKYPLTKEPKYFVDKDVANIDVFCPS